MTERVQGHFDASPMIRLAGSAGRIHLPKRLVPPIHARGQDDRWVLDDIVVNHDTIAARYGQNGPNAPRLTIDRRSGRIIVTGTATTAFAVRAT